MDRLSMALGRYRGLGLGVTRIAMGLILLQAGYTKVFIWKLPAVINDFEKMGVLLPQIMGPFIASLELVGGAALTLGLFTRWLGLVFAAEFCVATFAVAVGFGKGLGGAHLEIMLLVVALLLATNGGGALNLGTILRKGN